MSSFIVSQAPRTNRPDFESRVTLVSMKAKEVSNRKMLMQVFGQRVRKLRLQRGLTQRQLAELAGCETLLISRYERGAGLPNLDTLVALAGALQVSTDELALGRKPSEGSGEIVIQNVVLLDRFRSLQNLPRDDQDMVVKLVDAVIANRRVSEALTPARRRASHRGQS
jgi:transcriptional regulator with XRE-family HTH domain